MQHGPWPPPAPGTVSDPIRIYEARVVLKCWSTRTGHVSVRTVPDTFGILLNEYPSSTQK
jgi:hypothetical protein